MPATPRCLDWLHDSTPTVSRSNDPPGSAAPRRRPGGRHGSDRRSLRPPAAEFLGLLVHLVFLARTALEVLVGRTTTVVLRGRTALEGAAS
ncbi:hypothetical protein ACFVZT_02870 [Streptomyces sp. NPDC058321]|uniref:hypothetical protein n=1 Tax=Streptomyces sp. NPDC058321 TaxID=3346445 RepID=UPI0036F0F03C